MLGFELLELLHQRVILTIRDLRRGLDVIELVVTADLIPEFFDFALQIRNYPCKSVVDFSL